MVQAILEGGLCAVYSGLLGVAAAVSTAFTMFELDTTQLLCTIPTHKPNQGIEVPSFSFTVSIFADIFAQWELSRVLLEGETAKAGLFSRVACVDVQKRKSGCGKVAVWRDRHLADQRRGTREKAKNY